MFFPVCLLSRHARGGFLLFSRCRVARRDVFLRFLAVAWRARMFFFIFSLSRHAPGIFWKNSCCRVARENFFFCLLAVASRFGVVFLVDLPLGCMPGCFSLPASRRASHRWQMYTKYSRKQLFQPLISKTFIISDVGSPGNRPHSSPFYLIRL